MKFSNKIVLISAAILYFLGYIFLVWPALNQVSLIDGWLPTGLLFLLVYLLAGTVILGFIVYRYNKGKGF